MIYKYLPVEEATQSLAQGALQFRQAKAFNDPFDMAFHFTLKLRRQHLLDILKKKAEPDARRLEQLSSFFPTEDTEIDVERVAKGQYPLPAKLLSKLERITAEKYAFATGLAEEARVSCFSLEADNIALWSHYAADHTGVCLAFDETAQGGPFFPGQCFQGERVTYGESVEINIFDSKSVVARNVSVALSRKLEVWNYEAEYRVILPSVGPDVPATVTVPFDRRRLTELRFGLRSTPESRARVARELARGGYEAAMFVMERTPQGLVARPLTPPSASATTPTGRTPPSP